MAEGVRFFSTLRQLIGDDECRDILGRDREVMDINKSIESFRSNNGGALYVGGMPGTGKTFSIRRCCAQMNVMYENCFAVTNFVELVSRAFSIPKESSILVDLANAASKGVKKNQMKPFINRLHGEMQVSAENAKRLTIVILDEVDAYLPHKKSSLSKLQRNTETLMEILTSAVLKRDSGFGLFLISNTPDLVDRAQLPGVPTLLFPAYDAEGFLQIMHGLLDRAVELHASVGPAMRSALFASKAALELPMRKLASSGDCRVALQVFRWMVQRAEASFRDAIMQGGLSLEGLSAKERAEFLNARFEEVEVELSEENNDSEAVVGMKRKSEGEACLRADTTPQVVRKQPLVRASRVRTTPSPSPPIEAPVAAPPPSEESRIKRLLVTARLAAGLHSDETSDIAGGSTCKVLDFVEDSDSDSDDPGFKSFPGSEDEEEPAPKRSRTDFPQAEKSVTMLAPHHSAGQSTTAPLSAHGSSISLCSDEEDCENMPVQEQPAVALFNRTPSAEVVSPVCLASLVTSVTTKDSLLCMGSAVQSENQIIEGRIAMLNVAAKLLLFCVCNLSIAMGRHPAPTQVVRSATKSSASTVATLGSSMRASLAENPLVLVPGRDVESSFSSLCKDKGVEASFFNVNFLLTTLEDSGFIRLHTRPRVGGKRNSALSNFVDEHSVEVVLQADRMATAVKQLHSILDGISPEHMLDLMLQED